MKKLFALVLMSVLLVACGEDKVEVSLDPVAIHSGDECHVCGMIINEWPGPKGEVIDGKSGSVKKFCSTTDMLSWYLQPENKHFQGAVYVHDMAQSHWDKPDDQYLVDATSAFYVLGSKKLGMGATLASFSKQADAEAFAIKEGGRVLAFSEISIETLSEITRLGLETMDLHEEHHDAHETHHGSH